MRRAVGLRGEVEVEPLTVNQDRFQAGLELRAGDRRLTLEGARQSARGVALKLAGIDDRSAAEELRGAYLEVAAAAVALLREGSYYHWQLVGLEVVSLDGSPLGKIVDVQEYPANDVYVVRGGAAETLVPAIREVVREVDLEAGRMVVDLPPEDVVQ